MTIQKQPIYHSYLLRLWREYHSRQTLWRASLESVQTGETYHFSSVETLFTFLRQQMVPGDKQQDEKK